MQSNIRNVMAAIDYIESHLGEKLELETVAKGVQYSKYHLHRMFTDMLGLTIHDYVPWPKQSSPANAFPPNLSDSHLTHILAAKDKILFLLYMLQETSCTWF